MIKAELETDLLGILEKKYGIKKNKKRKEMEDGIQWKRKTNMVNRIDNNK